MKRRYSHLTLAVRRQIERWRLTKMSGDEIARRLGRHRSTVFRELRRNRHHDAEIPELTGTWGVLAQKLALSRRFRHRKLIRHPDLRHESFRRPHRRKKPRPPNGRIALINRFNALGNAEIVLVA